MRPSASREGSVVRIRLEPGPGGRTLIDAEGVAALRAALERAEGSVEDARTEGARAERSDQGQQARVLVLEGGEQGFCEGLDLAALLEAGGDPAPAVQAFAGCLARLRALPAVTIAAVDGACAGGGVGLAASADLVIASARSSFVLPELALGLLPALVLPALLERMPPARARRLALGGALEAREAWEVGLVDRVVEDRAALEAARGAAIKHALRLHPRAVGEWKELCARLAALEPAARLRAGAARSAELLGDPERRAGLRAFLEGEPLPWFERRGRRARS